MSTWYGKSAFTVVDIAAATIWHTITVRCSSTICITTGSHVASSDVNGHATIASIITIWRIAATVFSGHAAISSVITVWCIAATVFN